MAIGVVPGDAEAAVTAVEAAGERAVTGSGARTAPVVVAVGERALGTLVPDCRAPVLAVDATLPAGGVDGGTLETTVATLADAGSPAGLPTTSCPFVRVAGPGGETHALFDATLVTAEPARISEYGVATPRERIARFRADGVVLATPAGSHGYARDAGGPTVVRGTDAGVVVPIAPFTVDAERWVVPLGVDGDGGCETGTGTGADDPDAGGVRLTVERDEAAVDLYVDGERAGRVAPDDPVEVRRAGRLRLVDVTRLERH